MVLHPCLIDLGPLRMHAPFRIPAAIAIMALFVRQIITAFNSGMTRVILLHWIPLSLKIPETKYQAFRQDINKIMNAVPMFFESNYPMGLVAIL